MQKLTDLSDARLASVTNHKHNTILKALRDTDLSVAEIAKKLRVTKSSVYHVIEKYLPRDFLKSRASSRNNALFPAIDAKDGDKDDDLVIIVPPKKNEYSYFRIHPFWRICAIDSGRNRHWFLLIVYVDSCVDEQPFRCKCTRSLETVVLVGIIPKMGIQFSRNTDGDEHTIIALEKTDKVFQNMMEIYFCFKP